MPKKQGQHALGCGTWANFLESVAQNLNDFTKKMTNHHTENRKMLFQRSPFSKSRSLGKFSRNFLVVAIGMLVVLSDYHYRCHLLWKYAEWRHDLYAENTIPDSPMPKVEVPEDWIEYSLGCLRFSLPPDFHFSREATAMPDTIFLHNDSYGIIATLREIDEFSLLDDTLSTFVQASKEPLTFPRLQLELCKAGADKFCWSMSPKDVAKNTLFITLRSSFAISNAKRIETGFSDDVDRIVSFYGNHAVTGRAIIDWQSTSAINAGYIHVLDNRDNKSPENNAVLVNLTRRICLSIRCGCCACPDYLKEPENPKFKPNNGSD